jgi:phage baseplate assembly protein gpV
MTATLDADLLEHDDFKVYEDSSGNLVLEHKSTGATFEYDGSSWVVSDTLDLNDNDITNVSSLSINDLVDATSAIQSQVVGAGETVTIPSGKGQTVAGPLTVNGDIELDGTLTVVPGPITGGGSISGDGRIHIP